MDLAAGGPRFDVIIDTAGIRPFAELRAALRPTGTLVVVGGEGGGRWLGGFGRNLIAPVLSAFTRQQLRTLVASERFEDLETISELVRAGTLRPVIDRTFPLAEAAEAMRYLHSGEVRGKIVIAV
jgi:NADPH:quinone reductase-like Zn-dependent oxidoreductase